MFDVPLTPETGMSLLTLSALEVVLGIDNVVFISLLTSRLPEKARKRAWRLGLMGALVSRVLLMTTLNFLTGLSAPLFEIFETEFSWKSLLLIMGGLFLLFKATKEIHEKLDGNALPVKSSKPVPNFGSLVLQIVLLDIVFSMDSVITAVGMTPYLSIMIAANVVALGVMMWAADLISTFVERYASVKMLALSFLFMVGFLLLGEGFGVFIPKGYVYFAMVFSMLVEGLNLRIGIVNAKKIQAEKDRLNP